MIEEEEATSQCGERESGGQGTFTAPALLRDDAGKERPGVWR